MPKTKLNIIKPALGVNQMPDGDLLARLNAVHGGMLNNPAYPNPPVDMAAFKAAIEPIRLLPPLLSMGENRPSRSGTSAVQMRSSCCVSSDTTSRWSARATHPRLSPAVSLPRPASGLHRSRYRYPRS